MDKVSVIVPVYNAAGTIEKCLRSIMLQTYTVIEIIVVDDGSTDDSYQIIEKIKVEDTRIHLIHQKNKGVSAARNCGLKHVTGKYIMFVDADDFLDTNIVDKLLLNSVEQRCDVSIVNKIFHINDTIKQNVLYSEKQFCRSAKTDKDLFTLDLLTSYYDPIMNEVEFLSCGVTAKLFKSDLILVNNIEFQEGCHFGEDVLFNLECFEHATQIGYLDYDGYHFVIRTDSSTRKFRSHWKESHDLFADGIDKFIAEYKKDARFYEAATMMRASRISGLAVSYYFHKDNPAPFWERYKQFKEMVKSDKYWESINNVRFELLTKKQQLVIKLLRFRQYWAVALLSSMKGV